MQETRENCFSCLQLFTLRYKTILKSVEYWMLFNACTNIKYTISLYLHQVHIVLYYEMLRSHCTETQGPAKFSFFFQNTWGRLNSKRSFCSRSYKRQPLTRYTRVRFSSRVKQKKIDIHSFPSWRSAITVKTIIIYIFSTSDRNFQWGTTRQASQAPCVEKRWSVSSLCKLICHNSIYVASHWTP